MCKPSNAVAMRLKKSTLSIAMLAVLSACGGNGAADSDAKNSTENSLLPGSALVAVTTAPLATRQALFNQHHWGRG